MPYATRTDLENIYGEHNIKRWADLNNNEDGQHIQSRIAWALSEATAEMDDRLLDGPYTFPLTSTPYPETVINMTARLAGVVLYESRGLADADPEEDTLMPQRKKVNKWISDVLAGRRRIHELTRTIEYTAPRVITDEST